MSTVEAPANSPAPPVIREPWLSETARVLLKRFVACLLGGFVLGLMVNNVEGSSSDFGYTFNHTAGALRILV